MILYNGVFFTPGNTSVKGCLALRDGRIVYIGAESGSKAFVNNQTQFVDCHPFMGGRLMNSCLLTSGRTKEDYFRLIKQYADQHQEKDSILGFGWCHMPFGSIGPSKKDLERLMPDKPAIFLSVDYHSAWVNS